MSRPAAASVESSAAYAIRVAMLLNAILIAIALLLIALPPRDASVANERNWRAPRAEPPNFDEFRPYHEYFYPRT